VGAALWWRRARSRGARRAAAAVEGERLAA